MVKTEDFYDKNLKKFTLEPKVRPPLYLIEREMCPWAISKYFGDWVQTQGPKCENMLMDEQSVNHK
jgi:hypothetical protein